MDLFNHHLIVAHVVQAFSWMLIHSLWQGLLFAMTTAVILLITKKSSAALRYNLVSANFLLFIIACLVTFIEELNKSSFQHGVPIALGSGASPIFKLGPVNQFYTVCVSYFSANAPMVVLLWFIFFVFKSLKMMHGFVYIQRAKNKYTHEPAEYWKNRVYTLCGKLQLKKAVLLLESGYVKMPMVIGYLKPVILIPAGLLSRLPADQIEAILLHELAHIRRHDYVVNFLQVITESIFFFNPGLLWISALLRDERENCCDDIALAQTNNKKEFVKALISFKEYSLYGAEYTVAFPGTKNQLLHRVSRILNNQNKPFGTGEKLSFMAGIITLLAIVATAAIGQISHIKGHTEKVNAALTYVPVQHNSISIKVPDTVQIPKRKVRLKAVNTASHVKKRIRTVIADDRLIAQDQLKKQESTGLDFSSESSLAEARRDLAQARRDQAQARRDQAQARLDQVESRRAQAEARRSIAEAMNDRVKAQSQARVDQEEAERDRQQAMLDRAQARRDQAQVQLDLIQTRHDQELLRQHQ